MKKPTQTLLKFEPVSAAGDQQREHGLEAEDAVALDRGYLAFDPVAAQDAVHRRW